MQRFVFGTRLQMFSTFLRPQTKRQAKAIFVAAFTPKSSTNVITFPKQLVKKQTIIPRQLKAMIVINNEQEVRCESSDNSHPKEEKTGLAPKAYRTIRIAPPTVYDVLHIEDYSDEEIGACWYAPWEYDLQHKEIDVTVRMMQQNLHIDEDQFSTRGLESRARRVAVDGRQRESYKARAFVLQEQSRREDETENQREITSFPGIRQFDVATTYKDLSYRSKIAAYLAGVQDAKVAKSLEKDDASILPIRFALNECIRMPLSMQIPPAAA